MPGDIKTSIVRGTHAAINAVIAHRQLACFWIHKIHHLQDDYHAQKSLGGKMRLRFFLSCSAIALVVTALGYAWFGQSQVNDQYLLAPVTLGSLDKTIIATGKLEPKHYVEVGAQVSGQVQRIHVDAGDKVKAGQLLVEIDASVFETRVAQASAALEVKKAQLQQLQAELELARVRAKRNQAMFVQKAVSDDALINANTNVKVLQSRIRASVAQIKADEAALQGDKVTLGFATIYAPIDGTIASIQVRQGQTLNANQNAPLLLKISDLSSMTLRAEISEADVEFIHRGMPVSFATLGNLERRFHSTVRQVLPTPRIVNDVVLYQSLIDIDNPNGTLMDAMTTQVFFHLEQRNNVLVMPLSALKGRGKRQFTQVLDGDEMIQVAVRTGLKTRTHVEIVSGLTDGQQVVIGAKQTGAGRESARAGLSNSPRGRRSGL